MNLEAVSESLRRELPECDVIWGVDVDTPHLVYISVANQYGTSEPVRACKSDFKFRFNETIDAVVKELKNRIPHKPTTEQVLAELDHAHPGPCDPEPNQQKSACTPPPPMAK